MADPVFGAIQSADAIVSLIALSKKIIDYCQRLAKAKTAAQRILDRIQDFRTVVQGPVTALQHYRSQHLDHVCPNDRIEPSERVELLVHIDTAVAGCLKTLQSVDRILAGLFKSTETSRLENLNARMGYVKHEKAIYHLLSQLDGQKITLLIAMASIGFYDQQRMRSPERSADQQIQQLTVHINIGYEYFCSSLNKSRPPDIDVHSASMLDDDIPDDHRRTIEYLLLVRDLAKGVRGRLNQAHRPSATRHDSHVLQLPLITSLITDVPPSRPSPSPTSPDTEASLIEDAEPDILHMGIATGQKILPVTNLEWLDHCIESSLTSARQSVKDSSYDLAERHLEKAIAYSEQRERLSGGSPFVARVALLEELASICNKVYNWTAAIEILERLLARSHIADSDTNALRADELLPYARQSQLLATVFFDKYCMILSERDQALEKALKRASSAWNAWERLRRGNFLGPEESGMRLDCAQLMERILETSAESGEAEHFRKIRLRERAPSADQVSWNETPDDVSSPLDRQTSRSVHPDLARDRHDDYEAAKIAVNTSQSFILEQLFNSPSAPLSINEKFTNGQTILHYAATNGTGEMVRKILLLGANRSIQDDTQETALVKAIRDDRHEAVNILLQWQGGSIDVNSRLANGKSLLHHAIQSGAVQSVRKLLAHNKILIHVTDRDGRSPLHLCANDGDVDMTKILLSFGADPTVQDQHQRKPGYYTVRNCTNKHRLVFQVLMEYQAGKTVGASESTLVETILDRKCLTRREVEALSSYLTVYRKQPRPDAHTVSRSSSNMSGNKSKLSFLGRRKT